MSAEVFYQFFQGDRLLGEGRIQAPFTVGRQTDAALPPPVSILELASGSAQLAGNEGISRKLVIVPLSNRTVPRLSLKIELDTSGKILACNIHGTVELHLGSHEPLRPKQQLPLGTAGTICFPEDYQLRLVHQPASTSEFPATSAVGGGTLIAFDDEPPPFGESKSSKPQHRPGMGIFVDNPSDNGEDATHRSFTAFEPMLDESQTQTTRLLSMIAAKEADNHQELAVRLVRAALEAFKEPPGSKEFFDAAGRAAIQMIDLDRVAVLRKEREQWVCRTLCFRPGLEHSRATTRPFSRTLLSQMELNARTTCVAPQNDLQNLWTSIREIDRAVASPIFDEHKSIVGALYGDRLMGECENHEPIGELEAALLEVIASGISSSLAIKQEQRLRTSMAQFFSPVVLDQLQQDPTLLDGRVAVVSVLFCDIRGFSSVTERIGPTQAVAWINDVLTTLSQCVLDHDGVLVNYSGDELMAMWGAPGEQSDHAQRACLAAMDMLGQVQLLRDKWQAVVNQNFDLGIGINTGPASVGNTGSKQKFNYGPIGNTVNLASRVQGTSKLFGIRGLITEHTCRALGSPPQFQLRRLAKVRVVGIAQPLDLYGLNTHTAQRDLTRRYETALTAFEEGDVERAAGGLASLVQDYPDDRPTIMLLSRTVERLTHSDREFDPVWNLTSK